jgi:hypothetical protein
MADNSGPSNIYLFHDPNFDEIACEMSDKRWSLTANREKKMLQMKPTNHSFVVETATSKCDSHKWKQ